MDISYSFICLIGCRNTKHKNSFTNCAPYAFSVLFKKPIIDDIKPQGSATTLILEENNCTPTEQLLRIDVTQNQRYLDPPISNSCQSSGDKCLKNYPSTLSMDSKSPSNNNKPSIRSMNPLPVLGGLGPDTTDLEQKVIITPDSNWFCC